MCQSGTDREGQDKTTQEDKCVCVAHLATPHELHAKEQPIATHITNQSMAGLELVETSQDVCTHFNLHISVPIARKANNEQGCRK